MTLPAAVTNLNHESVPVTVTIAAPPSTRHMLSPSFTAILLLVMLPALAASTPAASGAGCVDGTWRAELIPASGQSATCVLGVTLIEDLTVVFRRDAYSIPYPPVLFGNTGVFLGSARVSAAGYSHGWTWMGVCLPQYPSAACDCSVSHTPATADDSSFTLYMACSVSYQSSFASCLGAYSLSPVNASSLH